MSMNMADEIEQNMLESDRNADNEPDGLLNPKIEAPDEDEDMLDLEEEDEEDEERLAALGLQRVGSTPTPKATPTAPTQVLNARGMPARIRKKNKLFYDDELINTPHHRVPSAKKIPLQKPTPTKRVKLEKKENIPQRIQVTKKLQPKFPSGISPALGSHIADRKIGQKIGMRLRNLLKLPKAHKWVCHEWFYSNIDRCLFSGDNDFTICLKESFPELKTRDLARIEWTKIRRMMGRPRRCSQAFFNQERLDLERKRNKIRALQQRKATDLSSFQDLPTEIPMQLVIGTKVTARLRKPQDGLYTGKIDAVDTSNNTYRITFERAGLGTHSVPDYEVLSNEPPDTMSIVNFQQKPKSRQSSNFASPLKVSPYDKLSTKTDPLLSGAMINKPIIPTNGPQATNNVNNNVIMTPQMAIGAGYPQKLLERIIMTQKVLKTKRNRIRLLKAMNGHAEKLSSYNAAFPSDFERRYAGFLIDLEKINVDLDVFLIDMQQQCQQIAPEPSVAAMLAPSLLRERCLEEATEIVQRNNNVITPDKHPIFNQDMLTLITNLTALMIQVKCLSDSDSNGFELKVLDGTMERIKSTLSNECRRIFQNFVELHMTHIKSGLGQGLKTASLSPNSNKDTAVTAKN